jgi:hypothetical protein
LSTRRPTEQRRLSSRLPVRLWCRKAWCRLSLWLDPDSVEDIKENTHEHIDTNPTNLFPKKIPFWELFPLLAKIRQCDRRLYWKLRIINGFMWLG